MNKKQRLTDYIPHHRNIFWIHIFLFSSSSLWHRKGKNRQNTSKPWIQKWERNELFPAQDMFALYIWFEIQAAFEAGTLENLVLSFSVSAKQKNLLGMKVILYIIFLSLLPWTKQLILLLVVITIALYAIIQNISHSFCYSRGISDMNISF